MHQHHHHHAGPGKGHGGHADPDRRSRHWNRLAIILVVVVCYMIAEVVGGLLANSLALLADAGHMLSDAAALALSLFALWISRRPPSDRRSYGYYRAEILAALVNGAALIAISIFILVEAYERLSQPPEIVGGLMMAIAAGGLVVNLVGLWLLHEGSSESLNIRGAWLHMMGDMLGSVAAIGAGLLIWLFDWYWIDAVASALISLLIIYSSWGLLQEAVAVLMESTPGHIDPDKVRDVIRGVPGVVAVHDLHIWTITSGMESLSAHVVAEDGHSYDDLLHTLRRELHDHFGIDHITIQIESRDFPEHKCPF